MKKALIILGLASFTFSNLKSSYAQEFNTGINPPVLQIEAEAPSLVKAPITLQNLSDQTITYGIFLRPFKANAEKTGEPNYDQDLMRKYQGFFENVQINEGNKIITETTLAPGQNKDLTLRINVPRDEKPGDHYFTVVFLAQDKGENSQSSLAGARGGIGINVLLTIGSKAEPEGRIASFNVPRFVSKGPVNFTLDLANHSDYYVTTNGNVIIKNMFGQPVGNLEFGPFNILANSNRLVSNSDDPSSPKLTWNENFLLGIYKAEVSVALSDRGPLLKETKTFYAFPLELALGIIILIIILSWLIKRARKRIESA
jgi:hypothetical protein